MLNELRGGTGKLKTVQVVYQPRESETVVGTAINWEACPTGVVTGMNSKNYDLDLDTGFTYSQTFSDRDMAVLCMKNENWIALAVQSMMDVMKRKMETQAWTVAIAENGGFATDDTSYNGDPINTIGANPNVKIIATKYDQSITGGHISVDDGLGEIRLSAKRALYCPEFAVFGSNSMTKYMMALKHGCCNEQGVDVGSYVAENGFAYFDSYRAGSTSISSTLSVNSVFSFDRGAFQFLYTNMYADPQMKKGDDTYVQDILFDEYTGLPFDYLAKYDCGILTITLRLAGQFITMPDDMYFMDDRLRLVNGINEYLITNPA